MISNNSGEFEVIEKLTGGKSRIRFTLTGTEKEVYNSNIARGEVKDEYYRTGHGTCSGRIDGALKAHYLHARWNAMIGRIYNKNNPKFKTYGGNGVAICDRWHCFEYYVEDIESMENSEKIKDGWQVDKDTKIIGNKIYSKETCLIISLEDNSKEARSRQIKVFIAKNLSTLKEELVEYGANEFCRRNPTLFPSAVSRCLHGMQESHNGYSFSYV